MDSSKQRENLKPGLYIIATPIGNLKDISARAIDLIEACDLVVCEDSRVTNKLLSHYGIKKSMLVYNDFSGAKMRPRIIEKLKSGNIIALVSDAGTPLISDPGYKLVREVIENNIYLTTIPGASSVIAALTISGLPSNRFLFEGFLPDSAKLRDERLKNIVDFDGTLIFFERASRVVDALKDIKNILGNREIAVVREITKAFEEVIRGKLDDLLANDKLSSLKGEVVILVSSPDKSEMISDNELKILLQKRIEKKGEKETIKDIITEISSQYELPRKLVYKYAVEISKKGQKAQL